MAARLMALLTLDVAQTSTLLVMVGMELIDVAFSFGSDQVTWELI